MCDPYQRPTRVCMRSLNIAHITTTRFGKELPPFGSASTVWVPWCLEICRMPGGACP